MKLSEKQDPPEVTEKPLRKAVATLAITRASRAITLVGRKVYNALLWHAQQDPTARKFSMPLTTVSRQIGFQSRNYEVLKQACRSLSSALVEWESPAVDEVAKWSVASMVAGVDIINVKGTLVIEWSFGHNLQEELLDPRRFAEIRLESIAQLRTVAAVQLYEICVRYKSNPSHLTSIHKWEWWYEVLRVQPGKKSRNPPQYKFFKRDTLNPAIAEVNALTEIDLELKEIKAGRPVSDIQIKVLRKSKSGPSQLPDLSIIETVARAESLGVTVPDTETLVEKFGEAEVERCLVLLTHRLAKDTLGRVGSPGKWLETVLQDTSKSGEKLARGRATPEDRGAALRHREVRMAHSWTVFQTLDYEIKEVHKSEFEHERLQRADPAYLTDWETHGLAGRLAGPLFKTFLCERLLGADWQSPDRQGA